MKKLLHNLRYGYASQVWPWLSMVIIKIGGPRAAAYISYWSVDWGETGENQTILCLYRESFIKDITELRKRTELNYPIVMGGFTRFQKVWFPIKVQEQTFYQKHIDESGKGFEKGCKYAKCLIQLVSKRSSVDGVLSANFDYWQDAVFKKVCKDLNIPFLVLSREHPIIPKVCKYVIERYLQADYRFEGTAIAVAGRSTKNVITEVKSICSDEQVVITGLPRYDAWLDVDTSSSMEKRQFITLLTFTKGYYADQTFMEVLNLFCEAAARHSKSTLIFLVKTKDAADTEVVKKIAAKHELSNLQCGHESALFDVLPKSRLVINYNSLSLVEAVMARSWIAIPAWGQCKDKGEEAMYSVDSSKVTKVVNFMSSPNALVETIAASVMGQLQLMNDEDIHDFVGEYLHIPHTGSYCREFESFIAAHLQANH